MLDQTGKTVVFSENRMTYYKLHPEQKRCPGEVIVMPNLPNDTYHRDLWYKKGYKLDPQDLMPGRKLEIIEGQPRFVLGSPGEIPTQMLTCPICGKNCVGEFGLNSHKRTHEKDK